MSRNYLCLDVGGTEIKAAVIDADGHLLQPMAFFPARSEEDREALLNHFTAIIRFFPLPTDGIRMAFPGPFDYAQGICLMQGLSKYDSLYGVSLRRELSQRLGILPEKIRFANDASAFGLGEMGFGWAPGFHRVLCICIGTGCGSAFGVDGMLAPKGTSGVPESGFLFDAPFQDGRIDDYLSRRGLMRLTQEQLGTPMDGKTLAQQVRLGIPGAATCFLAFGEQIRDALYPFLTGFGPQILCLGGQITRSADLFLQPLEMCCQELGIRLRITEDTSLRTMQGLTRI